MAHRERLVRFYEKYNADKIHEIDGVLERFKGKEAQLFTALVKKYGPEPGADEDEDAAHTSAAAPVVVKDPMHARLTAFYEKYNQEKLDEVETVLAKFKGKEAQLFNALVKKYGPEPGDDEAEDDDEEEEKDGKGDEEEDAEEDGVPPFKTVVYCPIDTLPPEYCEYGPLFQECKPWLADHCPDLYLQKYNRTVAEFLDVERQIEAGVEGLSLEVGGKTVKKKKKKLDDSKKKEDVVVHLSKSARKGKKRLTFIAGLDELAGINMKDASKALGKRFACSSSLSKSDTGAQQIQLQGDCMTELLDVLPEMFDISEDQIVVHEELKKK